MVSPAGIRKIPAIRESGLLSGRGPRDMPGGPPRIVSPFVGRFVIAREK